MNKGNAVTRKQKAELDELRKLGVAPAQEDEDGFYINPHIPPSVER